ncbi:hypothetical protein [Paludisphaera soli]|uniref:hypothetical protein n=1 Tax=Paludisphaera soli TaxID=2712865 RepID=UPI0013ED5DFA|nr:hypothetical protein [Paludisphaera soli]
MFKLLRGLLGLGTPPASRPSLKSFEHHAADWTDGPTVIDTTATGQENQYTWEPPAWLQDWEVSYPDDLEIVGVIRFVDTVRQGDVVWFDRCTQGVTLVRSVARSPPADPRERTYRLERGERPNSILIVSSNSP